MSLYVCESDIVKAHLAELGKVSCGKGCIRFRRIEDLNLSAVESILRAIIKRRKAGIGPSCWRLDRVKCLRAKTFFHRF
jgi:hypothetical protein